MNLGLGLGLSDGAPTEAASITYDSWATTGNEFTSVNNYAFPAPLNGTDIAVIDAVNEKLKTLRWDGTDFNPVGTAGGLDITTIDAGGVNNADGLIKLSTNRVVWIDHSAEELVALEWDGTDWAQVGNRGSFSALNGYSNGDYLSDNRVVVWGGDSGDDGFQIFDFDGTNFSTVGNKFSLTGNKACIAALTPTLIAVHETLGETLTAYEFGGTNWTQKGNQLATGLTTTGLYKPCAMSATQVNIFTSNTQIRTYNFDGTDFTTESTASSLTGLNSWPRTMVKMSDTLIAYHSFGDSSMRAAVATTS